MLPQRNLGAQPQAKLSHAEATRFLSRSRTIEATRPRRHHRSMDSGKVFLRADWRSLAMLNYEVDSRLLLKYLPTGTQLDHWHGKTFISLIGFRFLKTRVFGIRIPFHTDFDEVNLRFYVRLVEGNEVRRGVVFIREIVPRWAIATVARGFYNERYVTARMHHRVDLSPQDIRAEYSWKSRNAWNMISVSAKGEPALPDEDSLEQFITEHYWGYARSRDGGCIEYRVEHPRWRVWQAERAFLEGTTAQSYGSEFAKILRQPPSSAFLAEGSEVTVYRGNSKR